MAGRAEVVESDRYRLESGRLPEFRSGETSGETDERLSQRSSRQMDIWSPDTSTVPPYVHKTQLSCSRQAASTPTSTSGKDRIVAIHLAQKPFPVEKRGIVVQQRAVDRHARFLCKRLQQERVELDGRGDAVGIDVDERFRRYSRRLNSDGGDAARYRNQAM
jgi:hypothetical protein